ncbi:class C sortase [Enterococcus faecium]|uniref:class C sortase n=1 Tax=Enterococcus faecium TaxID=1352 RepID=UPI003513A3A9
MIIRKPPKRRVMHKLMIFFWLLSAVAVYFIPVVEANVAKFQQKQRILAIENLEKTDSSLDVAKIELGDPVGVLTIPSLSLKLPIYQGTSGKTLENGIGITDGTGDIEGGAGKNPLLSGHSGLYKDSLFDDLPSVKKGQKFFIKVNEEQHAYQIYRIEEIKAEELQENYLDYLTPEEDKDRITLMTCTPKGINSHRFLVYGERVPFNKEDLKIQKKESNRKVSPVDWRLAVLSAFFVVSIIFLYKKIRRG